MRARLILAKSGYGDVGGMGRNLSTLEGQRFMAARDRDNDARHGLVSHSGRLMALLIQTTNRSHTTYSGG